MSGIRPFEATTWQGNTALVVGPYRVCEVLGSGGNGLVYRAVHSTTLAEVALKILSPTIAADSTWRARFIREARQLAKISHPNVVGCSDLGEQDGTLYMALELVRGGDAEALVRRHNGILPTQLAVTLGRDAARGLQAVHEARLIHRDIKPSNLLLTEDGMAKLGDFGLVQVLDQHRPLTLGGKIVGTPVFMSPEQVDGNLELDFRSDLYSLASTLYYLLVGKPPFLGQSPWAVLNQVMASSVPDPRKVVAGVDDRVASVLLKAGAHKRDDRYRTAGAMAEDLDLVIAGRDPRHAPLVAVSGTPRIERGPLRMPRVMLVRPPGAGTDPLRERLCDEGFVVEALDRGDIVVRQCELDPPELLVLDLSDPQFIGVATLKAVRHLFTHQVLPVIVLSPEPEDAIEVAWRAGASQVLVARHMGPEDFLTEVRRAIGMDVGNLLTMPVTRHFSPQDARQREFRDRLLASCAHAQTQLGLLLTKPTSHDSERLSAAIDEVAGVLRAGEEPAAELDPGASTLLLAIQALLRELGEMPHHATPGVLGTVVRAIDTVTLRTDGKEHPSLAGRTALVVDDDPVSRLMMVNALRVVGLAADAVSEASTALAAAERRVYDLVLSDVMMEGLNGFQLVSRLRQVSGYATVPVIFVTSLADFDQFFRTISSGACDLIAKPFLLTELGLKALIHLSAPPMPPSTLAPGTVVGGAPG
jgi:DNA-binding response OmpR family regulator